ncbi:MAG: phosphoribosylglycinamide formyltransferase [Betaproteobacteria bacterium]|nr:phosphoribosylglycinamide formyltransferase [Betaproteobacteria bacterium]MDG1225868.1 phosphoribosylglycinamide formyltransferase [Burkholderiales bacterium]MDG2202718.1 phosphoribosylglycinamide formyltransferase [Burkholderiales bacterium]
MKKIVILISGRGSNMRAIIEAKLPYKICGVFSNNPDAEGISHAKHAGIETCVIDHRDYPDRVSYDEALGESIETLNPDLIVLAGFMRILTPGIINRFSNRIINIHPSIIPAFTGLNTHNRALAAGVRVHGCTVHFVTPDLDEGPIIAQAALQIKSDDTPQTLSKRVLALEHKILPKTITWILEGLCSLSDGQVSLDPKIFDDSFYIQR